jgi:hypothetical protein
VGRDSEFMICTNKAYRASANTAGWGLSILTQPNMYARGILFGKMKYELGDHSFVRCPENNMVADIEFKTKGYFGGTYNAIGGVIRNEQTQETLYELSGMWNEEMFIRDIIVRLTSVPSHLLPNTFVRFSRPSNY